MAKSPNISMEQLQQAMNDPSVRNCKPDQLINKISSMFGLGDLDPVDQSETEKVRDIYFQAFKLEADKWTDMGKGDFVQIVPFKLKGVPEGTMLVADVLIDQSDYEAECFDQFIRNMDVRGKSMVFHSCCALPIDIVLGLKCVDIATQEPMRVPDQYYRAYKGQD